MSFRNLQTGVAGIAGLCLVLGTTASTIVWGAQAPGSLATQPLIDAARHDDSAAVAALLARRVDVNARTEDGTTALAWAAMRSNVDMAARLLMAGANPNFANVQGVGPLSLAITNGSLPLVRLLLEKGANPSLARESGETPLMTAARMGQNDVVKLLLERGADVNARDKKFGQTAFMWAAGYSDVVRLLVDHKADLAATTAVWDVKATIFTPGTYTLGITGIPWNFDGDYTSKKGGQTALFFAVQKRDLESARILVEAGIDVNSASADGTTALLASLFKWENSEPVARKGLPGLGDSFGSSAIFAPDLPMAGFLLDRGAKVNVADGAGYTPLHGAVLAVTAGGRSGSQRAGGAGRGAAMRMTSSSAADRLSVVRRLLESGADPNRQTLYPTSGALGGVRINPASPGSSAFHIAATSHNLELVRVLADHGANPNLMRKDGHTPFTLAAAANDVEVVTEMVARGADLGRRYNPADLLPDPVESIALRRNEQTVMHIAAAARANSVIEYLFSQGVPLDLRNAMGETPLKLADDQELFEVARAKEGGGGPRELGRIIPRDSRTSDTIKRLLAERASSPAAK